MFEQAKTISNPEFEQPPTTLLYRGVRGDEERTRIGQWWTTNPYYAMVYANGGKGKMFVAQVSTNELGSMSHDVSQDEGYQNYGFVEHDPPGAREVTQDEVGALLAISRNASTESLDFDLPGGQLLKTPDDPIAAGRMVFDPTFEVEK